MKTDNKKERLFLIVILLLSLCLRLLFITKGYRIYYTVSPYINNDSASFTDSFLNWWHYGVYTHTLNYIPGYTGRQPGYPLFWGIHYLIFGAKHVYQAVSVTQALLDVVATLLLFQIAKKTISFTGAVITATIYCFYPFIIVWLTITGSEALATFITVLFFWHLFCNTQSKYYFFWIGALAAIGFYVRPYLGIFLPLGLLYALIQQPFKLLFIWDNFKKYLLASLVFLVLYLPWPIRNYIATKQVVLTNIKYSGYTDLAPDMASFIDWNYCWNTDVYEEMKYRDQIIHTNEKIIFPAEIFADTNEKLFADSIIQLCRQCGSSWKEWGVKDNTATRDTNCNQQINDGFRKLADSYKAHHYTTYLFRFPLIAFKNAVFKSEAYQDNSKAKKLLFGYRTIIVLFSFAGILLVILHKRRNKALLMASLFILFQYIFLCFFYRHLEIRYLLQADVIGILLCGYFLTAAITKYTNRKTSI